MGTDYSGNVIEDKSGTIRVAIHGKDLKPVRDFLNANHLRHLALPAGTDLAELTFGSDLSADAVRTILRRYAELA